MMTPTKNYKKHDERAARKRREEWVDGELPEEETDSRGAALGVARRRAATELWHGSLGWVPRGARASSPATMRGGNGACGGAASTARSWRPALRGNLRM